PRDHAEQPRGGDSLRQVAAGEPGRPAPERPGQTVAGQSPDAPRSQRLPQRIPRLGQKRTVPVSPFIQIKRELKIDGQMIEGEVHLAEGAAQLVCGGATLEAQVSEPEPGMFTVIINDRVYRCALEELPGGAVEVVVNGKRIPVAARDKKHLRGQAG